MSLRILPNAHQLGRTQHHPAGVTDEQNPVVGSMSGKVEDQSSTATRQQLNTHDDNMEKTIAQKGGDSKWLLPATTTIYNSIQ